MAVVEGERKLRKDGGGSGHLVWNHGQLRSRPADFAEHVGQRRLQRLYSGERDVDGNLSRRTKVVGLRLCLLVEHEHGVFRILYVRQFVDGSPGEVDGALKLNVRRTCSLGARCYPRARERRTP